MTRLSSVNRFSQHKTRITALAISSTLALSLVLWLLGTSATIYSYPLWLGAGTWLGLTVGLLISVHGLVKEAEKNVRDLRLANQEFQEESEERKWTEVMLQESRIYAESIVETIMEPVLVLDANLSVIKANRSFYDTFNTRPEFTLNRPFYDLGEGQWNVAALLALLKRIIPHGQQIDGYEFSDSFGSIGERTICLNGRRIYRKEDVTNLILITMEDVTEKKKAEQELARRAEELARSNTDLKQFAYLASHDLQEPLRMVSSYCQLLQRRYRDSLDSDANEFIDFAVSGAKRMQALINDLLIYSRVGTKKKPFVKTDCNAVLEQAKQNLKMAIQESAAVIKNEVLPVTVADDSQLVQLFQNLLGNAIKFSGERTPEISVSAEPENGEWVFSIEDNGIGIDSDFARRIFVIFQRLHTSEEYAGTGIGLSICKKIVERHGGRIWVDSEPAEGSTFCFSLPRKKVENHEATS